MPEQITLPGGAVAWVPTPAEMSANDRYNLLDPNVNTLADYQAAKIDALNESCNQTIVSGFVSTALNGTSHTYGFDLIEDQPNLTGRLTIINSNPNYPSPFDWKTLDSGPLPHTIDQFRQVCTDGDQWKDTNIAKYWQLKIQVQQATTIEEVEAIVWS